MKNNIFSGRKEAFILNENPTNVTSRKLIMFDESKSKKSIN